MSLYKTAILLSTILVLNAAAETKEESLSFQEYVDKKHEQISDKVVEWSKDIDEGVSSWLENPGKDLSCDEREEILNEELFKATSIDAFFKSDKYIDETERRFVRVRLGSFLQSKESIGFNYKIRVQIPLRRTKERFNIFIDGFKEDYFDKNRDTINEDESKKTPDIGINYFSPEYHGIKSRYSIGTRGLSPYVRARFYKEFELGEWIIEPAQQFRYSIKNDWSEETNLYFDRVIQDTSLLRITLHRKTQAHVDGFDYRFDFEYLFTKNKKTGLSFRQSFWGNTKYRYTIDDTTDPVTESESFSGISDYSTSLNWRQSVWRKWFAYEVQPGINFHRQYDYKPNYTLRLNLEFYFGSI